MDVHAPHQPVHTWRDFAIHLTIVTIGLFIALSLEALVEYIHHRHLVAEARENIHRELEANHTAAQHDLKYTQGNIGVIVNNIKTLHAIQAAPHGSHYSITNTIEFESFSNAAWRTARDTGALGYMPYDEVQRYSDLYASQDLVDQHVDAIFERNILAQAPFDMGIDPTAFSPTQYLDLLRSNAEIQAELTTLTQIIQQYDAQSLDVLKH